MMIATWHPRVKIVTETKMAKLTATIYYDKNKHIEEINYMCGISKENRYLPKNKWKIKSLDILNRPKYNFFLIYSISL